MVEDVGTLWAVTNATPEEWEALLQAAAQLPAPPPDAPTTTDAD